MGSFDKIFKVGGAQAVAALAYGTDLVGIEHVIQFTAGAFYETHILSSSQA